MTPSEIKKFRALAQDIADVQDALNNITNRISDVMDGGADSVSKQLKSGEPLTPQQISRMKGDLKTIKAMLPDVKSMKKEVNAFARENPTKEPDKYSSLNELADAHKKFFTSYARFVKTADELAQANAPSKTCLYELNPPNNPMRNASMVSVCKTTYIIWKKYFLIGPVFGA